MSHSEEPSPKRQRRSYSPASPLPPSETKPLDSQHNSHSLPQTPPPSVHMSPSWQSQQQSTSGPASVTFPTPPSTSSFPGAHSMERGSSETGQYTPMTDTDQRRDGDADAEMQDRRTDHDRGSLEQVPGAQKVYRLTTEPIAPSRPHPSQNIISLYSLESIQASVARRDAQGNKINKLRKSYENKVKAFGVLGRTKAEVGSNALVGVVDPAWDADMGNGLTPWTARCAEIPLDTTTADDLIRKLDAAFSFGPGHLPKAEHAEWKSLVGLDEVTGKPPLAAAAAVKPAVSNPALVKTAATHPVQRSAPSSPGSALRPERANKKRRYDESSYAGYQEGYDDDGYSTGGPDDRRASAAKRQKRKVSVPDIKIQDQKRSWDQVERGQTGGIKAANSAPSLKKARKA